LNCLDSKSFYSIGENLYVVRNEGSLHFRTDVRKLKNLTQSALDFPILFNKVFVGRIARKML